MVSGYSPALSLKKTNPEKTKTKQNDKRKKK